MENEIKFPDYCCFGKRQHGQLIETSDGITAVYEIFGIKVHELSYNESSDHWTLKEFSPAGKRTMFSHYSTLDRTICSHMFFLEDIKNPWLNLLREKFLGFGPVWLAPLPSHRKKEESTTYSPAGKLLAVRLLLSAGGECGNHIRTLKELIEYHDPEARLNLKMHDFYQTSLIITRNDGSHYWYLAYAAEYVVPLAFVYDTVKLLYDKGLISLNGLDRVMIQDASTLDDSQELVFGLNTIPEAKTYTVLLKGLLKSHDYFDQQRKNMEVKYQVKAFLT